VSQLIVPVKIASPDAEGNVFHIVQAGQSFWSIAVAYKITIKDLEIWNNLSKDNRLQMGQKLFIPGPNTKGYATPTPVGMIIAATPDPDGKIIHTVASYQTLSTITLAYGVTIANLLVYNGIKEEWPLQIGQKLVISPGNVTPSPTPRPLTPVEKLTPASDGKYYHVIRSGETLSWIADLYQVNVSDLMAWNGLNAISVIYPDNKLLLQVTPPATQTNTPGPATATATLTPVTPSETATLAPSQTAIPPTVAAMAVVKDDGIPGFLYVVFGLAAVGMAIILVFGRRKSQNL
jgi:LysM repeat protein